MHKISAHDAEKKLRLLLGKVDCGENVVITRGDSVVQAHPYHEAGRESDVWKDTR